MNEAAARDMQNNPHGPKWHIQIPDLPRTRPDAHVVQMHNAQINFSYCWQSILNQYTTHGIEILDVSLWKEVHSWFDKSAFGISVNVLISYGDCTTMVDKIIKSFAKRSRNTKSEASNDSPLSGLFILPIPQFLVKIVGSIARNARFGSIVLWNLEEASHETIILEAFSVKIVGSIVRNARFGSMVLWNLKEASHETIILEVFSVKIVGSIARNACFGSSVRENCRKHRTKQSFWKLFLWKLSEASHKTIILEAFWWKLSEALRILLVVCHTSTTTKTPPQKHHHKTPPQKHHHKNTTTRTPPQKHHHKNTTKTPPQKHHHKNTSTKTPPHKHHHRNTTRKTPAQKHHHKNTTTRTPPQKHHHKNTTTKTPPTTPPQKHHYTTTKTLPQ